MNCEICFYQENKDWKNIDESFKSKLSSKVIITNDEHFRDFLNDSGYDAKSIFDIFPSEHSITYQINQQSKDELQAYAEHFRDIKFRGFEIFTTLEPSLLSDIQLVNQVKHILKEKKNFLFLFKNFSFSYFVVQKYFSEQGLSQEKSSIKRLIDGKEVDFEIKSISKLRSVRKKYNFLKTYTQKSSSENPDTSTLITTDESSSKLDFKTNLKKRNTGSAHVINKIISYKLQNILSTNFEKSIFERIDLKFESHQCLFFATPSDDYVLEPIYNVCKVFEDNKFPYSIVVFDLQTNSQIEKAGMPIINFAEEVYVLSNSLKKNKQAIELKETLEKIITVENLNFLKHNNSFNPIIDEIFSSLAIMSITEFLLKKIIPSSIACINDGTRIANSVISVAKKLEIISFSILTLGLTPDPFYGIFKSDQICIYGTQGSKILESFGFSDSQIHVTGNPRYDNLTSISREKSKSVLENSFQIDPTSKLVILGFSRWYDNDEVWLSNFIKFCNIHDYEIFIKVHPIYKNTLDETHQKKVDIINKNCSNEKFHISIDVDSSILLSASDLVVTDHSNLGVEAILLNKPVINANFTKNNSKGFEIFRELKSSLYIDNYDDFKKYVIQILDNNDFNDDLFLKREQFYEKFNKFNDGKASYRIFKLMTENHNNDN